MPSLRVWRPLAAGVLLAIAYGNHFHNGFHFDDDHAIVSNPQVRELRLVPRYFVDATTFSVLPQNQSYRPVAQTTFAIDYAIGGGYDARVFQVDTFAWFILLLGAIYALVVELTGSRTQALLVAVVFGVHPAVADTVNYVVQRAEILAALGVVWGLALCARDRGTRPSPWFVLPVVVGMLAKPTAAAFPLLVAAYLWMWRRRLFSRELAVAVVVTGAAAAWVLWRTPASTKYGSVTPLLYVATQPFTALRYFAAFFAPVSLSVDPGWPTVAGPADPTLWVGVAFVAAAGALVWWWREKRSTRAVAFGLAWFLLAQLPTALVPLVEVGNDWRMFLPFIGLAIASVALGAALVERAGVASQARSSAWAAVLVAALLVAESVGTRARNAVWRSDETLWRDALQKNALNARAWMNYGVALMSRGDYAGALDACERALPLAPEYTLLHVNLGVAYGAVGRGADAEREFLTAQRLAPDDWRTHLYYGAWLDGQGRAGEARREADRARALNPLATPNQ